MSWKGRWLPTEMPRCLGKFEFLKQPGRGRARHCLQAPRYGARHPPRPRPLRILRRSGSGREGSARTHAAARGRHRRPGRGAAGSGLGCCRIASGEGNRSRIPCAGPPGGCRWEEHAPASWEGMYGLAEIASPGQEQSTHGAPQARNSSPSSRSSASPSVVEGRPSSVAQMTRLHRMQRRRLRTGSQ
jgi:hypothetical protein